MSTLVDQSRWDTSALRTNPERTNPERMYPLCGLIPLGLFCNRKVNTAQRLSVRTMWVEGRRIGYFLQHKKKNKSTLEQRQCGAGQKEIHIGRVRFRSEAQRARLPCILRNDNILYDSHENGRDLPLRIQKNEWLEVRHNRSAAWLPNRRPLSCKSPKERSGLASAYFKGKTSFRLLSSCTFAV